MTKTNRLVLSALCAALGVLLPLAFHAVPDAGSIFLPMHIPVLLCGLLCGWPYGLACGILTPLLSFLLTGMPPAPVLPGMVCELAVYGASAALFLRLQKKSRGIAAVYLALIGAMLAGRVVSGVLKALIFQAGAYSLNVWLTASFLTALPGILAQLALIPPLAGLLQRVRAAQET